MGATAMARGTSPFPSWLNVIDQSVSDELAQIVSMLRDATLRGFCRVIEKALGARHA